jgi:hypothetical protein
VAVSKEIDEIASILLQLTGSTPSGNLAVNAAYKAIQIYISDQVAKARIDELEHIVSGSEYGADDFDWYEKTQDEYTGTRYYSEVRHLSKTDRIAELKRSKE